MNNILASTYYILHLLLTPHFHSLYDTAQHSCGEVSDGKGEHQNPNGDLHFSGIKNEGLVGYSFQSKSAVRTTNVLDL